MREDDLTIQARMADSARVDICFSSRNCKHFTMCPQSGAEVHVVEVECDEGYARKLLISRYAGREIGN